MKKTIRKEIEEYETPEAMVNEKIPAPEDALFDPATMIPSKLEHFPIYNAWARKNKLPVKVPTEDYYEKVKVRFQRFDQPTNILKAYVRNKDIEWKGQLKPGKTYNLCKPVVRFLNSRYEPIFAEVKVDDGGETITETRQVGERARFSCTPLEYLNAA